MRNIISVLLWPPVIIVRLVLILIGLVVVPFTKSDNIIYGNNEDPVAPKWFKPAWPNWFREYWWRAIRNPTNNVRYLITEPKPDVVLGVADPDKSVRSGALKSAHRFTRAGLYSEYWYLKKVKDEYFEFRIGWKFSKVPGFGFTMQFRLGG